MSKDLEALKIDIKKIILKSWTKKEVEKLDEFMEDVIKATMSVNNLPIIIEQEKDCWVCGGDGVFETPEGFIADCPRCN